MSPALVAEVRATKWVGHKWGIPWNRNMRWTHPLIVGLTIRHCGHPTALRPYYLTFQAECPISLEASDAENPLFRKFRTLRMAQAQVMAALDAEARP